MVIWVQYLHGSLAFLSAAEFGLPCSPYLLISVPYVALIILLYSAIWDRSP